MSVILFIYQCVHHLFYVSVATGEQLRVGWPLRTSFWFLWRKRNSYNISMKSMYVKSALFTMVDETLQWRHNDHDDVSNHRPHVCLLNRLFRRRSKKTSKLRVTGLCAGNSPVTGEFATQRPVTRKMFPFYDVIMNLAKFVGVFKITLDMDLEDQSSPSLSSSNG